MVPVVGISFCQPSQQALSSWDLLGRTQYPVPALSFMCFLQLVLADSEGYVASICINKTFLNSLR